MRQGPGPGGVGGGTQPASRRRIARRTEGDDVALDVRTSVAHWRRGSPRRPRACGSRPVVGSGRRTSEGSPTSSELRKVPRSRANESAARSSAYRYHVPKSTDRCTGDRARGSLEIAYAYVGRRGSESEGLTATLIGARLGSSDETRDGRPSSPREGLASLPTWRAPRRSRLAPAGPSRQTDGRECARS